VAAPIRESYKKNGSAKQLNDKSNLGESLEAQRAGKGEDIHVESAAWDHSMYVHVG
jgi:hypothetical protein